MEAQGAILFLLGSPVPIQSNTVIAGLALPLAIEAIGLFFAAESVPVSTNRMACAWVVFHIPLDFATFAWPEVGFVSVSVTWQLV